MSDIFLSYASEDRERVRPLAEALIQEGWSVFWDRDIPVGKTWHDVLEEELKTARSIVVVWSQNSIMSHWVKAEANESIYLKLLLFPVLIDAVRPPVGFSHIQAADFTRWDGATDSPVFHNLVRDIKRTLGPPATPEHEPTPTEIKSPVHTAAEPEMMEPEPVEAPPSEPTPHEAEKGRLWVNTEPGDAMVRVLNFEAEFSQGMALEPGRYELEVTAGGYEIKQVWVELVPGEEKHLSITLSKLKGRLWVENEPKDATVKIVNLEAEFVQGMELEPGRYEVEVSAKGYETKKEGIELGAEEDRHFIVKLSPVVAPDLVEGEKPETIEAKPAGPVPTQPVGPELAEPPLPQTPKQVRRRRAWLVGGLAGLALLLLVAGLWWFLTGRPPEKIATLERQPEKRVPEEESQPVTKKQKTITNSIGMKFVLIPAGTFQMGSGISPDETAKRYGGEDKWFKDEYPQHQVTLSQPFYLQTTEVTQGQWQKVMDDNPSHFNKCGQDCPVERVSWYDAQEFIKKLNRMEKTDKYRLPTEAEWEYACRGGSTSVWSFGDDEAKLGEYAWYLDNSKKRTQPVGKLKPNAWGLYDMHGNVYEWCQDWYGKYPADPVADPTGPTSGESRVSRGGSCISLARFTRSAFRIYYYPVSRYYVVGFRVARGL